MLQKKALAEMEHSGLIPLIQQDKLEDLGRMHALFRRVDGGAELMRQVSLRRMLCTAASLAFAAAKGLGRPMDSQSCILSVLSRNLHSGSPQTLHVVADSSPHCM